MNAKPSRVICTLPVTVGNTFLGCLPRDLPFLFFLDMLLYSAQYILWHIELAVSLHIYCLDRKFISLSVIFKI